MIINESLILEMEPCKDRLDNALKFYRGKSFTPRQFMGLKNITHHDKMWVAMHLIPKDKLRYALADVAELVLPVYEKVYPQDSRPRRAIEAARHGNINETYVASRDAYVASHNAYIDANYDAAYAADAAAAAATSVHAPITSIYAPAEDVINDVAFAVNEDPIILKKIRTICLRYMKNAV